MKLKAKLSLWSFWFVCVFLLFVYLPFCYCCYWWWLIWRRRWRRRRKDEEGEDEDEDGKEERILFRLVLANKMSVESWNVSAPPTTGLVGLCLLLLVWSFSSLTLVRRVLWCLTHSTEFTLVELLLNQQQQQQLSQL